MFRLLILVVVIILLDSVSSIHHLRSRVNGGVGVGVIDERDAISNTHTHAHTHTHTVALGAVPHNSMNDFSTGALSNGRDRGYWNRMRCKDLNAGAPAILAENSDITANALTQVVSGVITYTKDSNGRVVRATATVGADQGGNNNRAVADCWLDAMYYFSKNPVEERLAQTWTAGHIIGKQLGGFNKEPLNFFPHHVQSNGAGVYHRMESAAAAMRKMFNLDQQSQQLGCVVKVIVTFTYPANFNRGTDNNLVSYIPTGGTYTGEISPEACGARITAINIDQFQGTSEHGDMRVAKKWIVNGNLNDGVYRVAYQWVNGPNPNPFNVNSHPFLFV